jgi:hypothetical protein
MRRWPNQLRARMLNSSPVTGDRRDEAARRTVSFQDDVRRAPATPPAQPVGMAESDRNKSSWQKPAYTQSVHRRNRQNGDCTNEDHRAVIGFRVGRMHWQPAERQHAYGPCVRYCSHYAQRSLSGI